MTKSDQRHDIRERLKSFPAEARQAASLVIAERVLALPEFRAAKVVALYAPLRSEPDTESIFAAITGRAVFPLVNNVTKQLHFHHVRNWSDLIPGQFGVREPDPQRCALVPACEIDLILVPGVAFDRERRRLGRGGGFYDRLLEQLPASTRRVGVFFGCQEVAQVVHETHDQPLERIVTEKS